MRQFFLSLLVFLSVNSAAVTLTKENTIYLMGPITPISVMMMEVSIQNVVARTKEPRYLVIHSVGGMLQPTEVICKMVAAHKNLSALVIVGFSGAAAIFECVPRRLMVKSSVLMFHRVSVGMEGRFTFSELDNQSKTLRASDHAFARLCQKRMSISLRHYWDKVKDADWFVETPEALKIGAADEQVVATCDQALKDEEIMIPIYHPMSGQEKFENFCNYLQ